VRRQASGQAVHTPCDSVVKKKPRLLPRGSESAPAPDQKPGPLSTRERVQRENSLIAITIIIKSNNTPQIGLN